MNFAKEIGLCATTQNPYFWGLFLMIPRMLKKSFPIVLLIMCATAAFGQDQTSEKKATKGRPDIPGTFLIDFGFDRFTNAPNDAKIGFWGSRTLNLYYQYDMQIGHSKFSFHPGVGFGMDRYKFVNYRKSFSDTTLLKAIPTLTIDGNGNTTFVESGEFLYGDTLRYARKSQLITNYLDIPLELRFTTNPDDPARSFKFAVGARFGLLLNSKTKLKYKADGEIKKLKSDQDLNLNPIRYGIFFRVGVGNFNVFTYYNMSPLFKEGKGPNKTDTSNITIGISLVSF